MSRDYYRIFFVMFIAYNGIAIFSFFDTRNYAYIFAAICANCLITFLSNRK
jgi:hypothetical protein